MNIIVTPFVIGLLGSTVEVFYEYDLVREGAKFYVYKEKHTKEQLTAAKAKIRWKDDVVSLTLIKGSLTDKEKERLIKFDQYVEVEGAN